MFIVTDLVTLISAVNNKSTDYTVQSDQRVQSDQVAQFDLHHYCLQNTAKCIKF